MTQLKWVPVGLTVWPCAIACEQHGRGTAQQQQASGLRRSAMHVRALLLAGGLGTAPSAQCVCALTLVMDADAMQLCACKQLHPHRHRGTVHANK